MQIVQLTVGFVLLTLLFWVLESLWPSIPGQRKLRPGVGIDLMYWFFSPLVTKPVNLGALLIVLAPVLLFLGYRIEADALLRAAQEGHGPVRLWPTWLQALFVVAGGDFIEYWSHRWFHGRRLWRFHAIHHSSKEVDWLSSVRLHPLNDLGTRLCQTIPFVLLGFSSTVVAGYIPFLTLWAILLHANVSWTFGPLRYVLASPAFHRWHHTREDAAIDKNFAGLFPIYDLLFGTFYLPADRQPAEFGVTDDSVPESFLGQMFYPFERPPRID